MSRTQEVEAWYKANAENIKKRVNKRSKQDAEDILQNTAIELLQNPAKWQSISRKAATKRAAWEFYNPARGFKGEGVELVSLDKASQLAGYEDLTEALIAKKSVELVVQLLNSLDESVRAAYTGFNKGNKLLATHKKIFIMHFFEEMGYEEIAEKLDMTHGSAREWGRQANKIVVNKFNEIISK